MSAYLVSEKTIHRVVTALELEGNDRKTQTHESLSKLGRELYALNNEAISQRYGEREEVPDYHFQLQGTVSPIQLYKSLRCFLYQCSEGKVPEDPLFKIVEEKSNELACKIVHGLRAYDEAEWS